MTTSQIIYMIIIAGGACLTGFALSYALCLYIGYRQDKWSDRQKDIEEKANSEKSGIHESNARRATPDQNIIEDLTTRKNHEN